MRNALSNAGSKSMNNTYLKPGESATLLFSISLKIQNRVNNFFKQKGIKCAKLQAQTLI